MDTGHGLEEILRIPHAIAGERTYDGVLRAMAGELSGILPFDHIDIVMLLSDGRDHVCYETPIRTVWSALADAPQPTGLSPVRSVLYGTATHILTDDAFSDARFHFEGAIDQPIFEAMLRSRVIVPLQVRGRIFGSISISRQSVNAYGPEDLLRGQRCADLVAPYLFALSAGRIQGREDGDRELSALRESLVRLADHLESERRRLGMDLHDQTMADLSLIARKLAAADSRTTGLRPVLDELRADIQDCLSELRRIVEDALPTILDLFGFSEALMEVMRRTQAGSPSPMRLSFTDRSDGAADRLSAVDRTLVYRIAQEAINNAARHSEGRTLAVRVAVAHGTLIVDVEDDGRGGVDLRSRGGISHMRTRAALAGARVEFAGGRTGRGTRVRIRMPLAGPGRPQ